MVLTRAVWSELIELGLLNGDETCALCPQPAVVLVDVARAPILLCPQHARSTLQQLQADLHDCAAEPQPRVTA
jgi:hypothetical protein